MKRILCNPFLAVVCFVTALIGWVPIIEAAEAPSSGASSFYSIALPRQLFLSKATESRDCVFAQKKFNQNKTKRIAIICVERVDPRGALSKIGFSVQNGAWVIGGSMDTGPAKIEFKQDSVSIHGQASCGVSDSAGVHAAGGLCYSFLIFSSHYAVYVQSTGDKNDIDDVASLASLIRLAVKPSAGELRKVFFDASDYKSE